MHLSKRNGSIRMTFEKEESVNSRTSSEDSAPTDVSSSEEVTMLTNASSDDEAPLATHEETTPKEETTLQEETTLPDINDNPALISDDAESVSYLT